MEGVDFRAITHSDSRPTLLLRANGCILELNPAARETFVPPRPDGEPNLADLVEDSPTTVRNYLARCAGTRDAEIGALSFKTPNGAPRRFRCDGSLVRPAAENRVALVILRCRAIESAHDRFLALTETIEALHAENHLRSKTQQNLEAALREKETLLREVHHRVKNNLQVIAGIFSMEVAREQDSRVRQRLQDASRRVQALAAVQRVLYQSDSLARLDAPKLLTELSESIRQSCGTPNVSLTVDAPPATISLEIATPLGLIVNELLSNAFKHAFPDDRPGRVRVGLEPLGDGRFRLVIEDDGIGSKAGLPGLGLTLVEGLAVQLDGELRTESTPGGTRIGLTFRDAG